MEMKDVAPLLLLLLLLLLLFRLRLRLPLYLSHVLDNSGSSDEVCTLCLGSGKGNGSCDSDELNGRRIGSLFISSVEIGRGSSGTTVFKGTHGKRDGKKRHVAVKRLVKGHQHLIDNEIEHFILSDGPPNILQYYAEESDRDFVYLALELCDFSLDDLIRGHSNPSNKPDFPQNVELLRADGRPSPLLLELMRGIVLGLVHLHKLGLIHRDLNPRNVLITMHPSFCAKLSDMGISKLLPLGKSSMGYPASGSGTREWQAPEQLLQKGSQTCKMDMFNLGCVLFFCLTGGSHPFGDQARDLNIEENKMDLSSLKLIPEAHDLISRLLNQQSELRPKASEVLCHPFFWSSEKRLSFCRCFSDRLELENRHTSKLLKELECTAPVVFGKSWIAMIHQDFMSYLKKYRSYDGRYVEHLLRAERNAISHLWNAPINVQEIVGSGPENLEDYFTKRFPSLLMESHKVAFKFFKEEPRFQKFFLEYQLSDVLTP